MTPRMPNKKLETYTLAAGLNMKKDAKIRKCMCEKVMSENEASLYISFSIVYLP